MQQSTLIAAGLALSVLGIADVAYAVPEVLSNAQPIELSNGSGVGSGAVSTGQEVFSFEASEGDTVTLDVNVTQTLEGTQYTDDDSQLFLFNSDGVLIAENDDADATTFQSLIQDFVLPEDGTYYAVVTTWDNNPVLDENDVVIDWGENGGSNIEFDLLVEVGSATPAAQ